MTVPPDTPSGSPISRLSGESFIKMFKLFPDAVAVTRLSDGKYLEVNDGFSRLSGYTREESLGRTGMELGIWMHPEERESLFLAIRERGESSAHEATFQRKDGSTMVGLISGRLLDIGDEPCALFLVRDISERKRMEEALRASEDRYRMLIDEAVDGIVLGGPDGKVVGANAKACEMTGFSQGEFLGRHISEFFSKETLARVPLRFDLLDEGRRVVFERNLLRRDGTELPIEMNTKQMPDGTYQAIFRDLTSRKQAEEALRASEERYRLIYASAPLGILHFDRRGVIQDCNPKFEEIIGSSRDVLVGFDMLEQVRNEGVRKTIQDALEGKAGWYEGDYVSVTAQKRTVIRMFTYRILSEDGDFLAGIGVVEDITERKLAEEALARERILIENVVDRNPYAIQIADTAGHIIRSNSATKELFGSTPHPEYSIFSDPLLTRSGVAKELRTALEGRTVTIPEIWYDAQDVDPGVPSKRVCVRSYVFPIQDPNGVVQHLAIMHEDITDRKLAEQALRESEDHFRTLFETMTQGVIYLDREGRITSANSAAQQMLGLTRQELRRPASQVFRERIIHEDGRPFAEEENPALAALWKGRPVLDVVMGIEQHPDRRHRWVVMSAMPQFRPGETRPWQVHATLTDITHLKRTQDTLRATEKRLRAILTDSPAIIYQLDQEGTFRVSEGRGLEILGLKPGEAVGRSALEMYRNHPMVLAQVEQALSGSPTRGLMEVGEVVFDNVCRPVFDDHGQVESVIGIAVDVTARMAAEQALRESEKKFRELIERLGEGFGFVDPEERFSFANPAAEIIFGVPPGGLVGRSLSEFVDDSDFQEILRQTADRKLNLPGRYEHRIRRPNGEVRQIYASVTPWMDEDGGYLGANGLFQDVTERKKIENELRESEDRFRGLFMNTTDTMFWIRVMPDGTFVVEGVNPAQEAALGIKSQEIVGKQLHEFLPKEMVDPILANYRRCLKEGKTLQYEETAELSGTKRTFETLIIPIRNAEGRIYRIVGTSRDITHTRQAEEALRQAQKLESLGVLAGGIAHDFNNLLTALLGNLNLAQLKLSPESPAMPHLENVERTVLKASELTKQMLAYSGKGRFVVKHHDLNQVVQEMTHLLNVSISKKVALHYSLMPSLPPVEADAAQIQQVVMNLVTNASDAIGDREGVIRIATRFEELEEKTLRSSFATQNIEPGPFVVLEVADSGSGMTPEIMQKIFDPFFTTKRSGRGLGLSAMLGILRGHHAGIQISSDVGWGSTFTLYFPASLGAPTDQAAPDPSSQKSHMQGQILLVDDEPEVRESTQAMLEALGFEVLTAVDGRDAVDRFLASKESINLVLMDLTMPRMDGREAFRELRGLRADLPVILYSGYSEQDSLGDSMELGLLGFLQKPFTMAELRKAVQQALSEH